MLGRRFKIDLRNSSDMGVLIMGRWRRTSKAGSEWKTCAEFSDPGAPRLNNASRSFHLQTSNDEEHRSGGSYVHHRT